MPTCRLFAGICANFCYCVIGAVERRSWCLKEGVILANAFYMTVIEFDDEISELSRRPPEG